MNAGKLGRIGGACWLVGLAGAVALAPAAQAGKKAKKSKNVTKTYTQGRRRAASAGVQTTIPDGGGDRHPGRALGRSPSRGSTPAARSSTSTSASAPRTRRRPTSSSTSRPRGA